eukprot:gene30009-36244_t
MSEDDEAFARRLQAEEFALQTAQQQIVSQRAISPRPPVRNSNRVELQQGHSLTVKLHHTSSNRQIGEAVIAHYLETNVMAFELANNPGRYLKARANGTLDYSTERDEASKFLVDTLQGGNIVYLISKQFREAVNRGGGVGWYLTLSPEGELFANGVRGSNAQWSLVSAGQVLATTSPPQPNQTLALPPAPPTTNPLHSANATPARNTGNNGNTSATPSYLPSESIEGGFPGFDAGREELMRFFHSPAGGVFLAQRGFEGAKDLFQQDRLAALLHRPDWPLLARQAPPSSS